VPTLHVHIDESGDLNFAPGGTRYYIFTAAWTYEPALLAARLTALRFSLLKGGHDLQRFHATNDRQTNRDQVVKALSEQAGWAFAAVVIEKAKVYPDLREPYRFYPQFASSVLKYIFRRHVEASTTNVLVFTDTLPVKAKRDAAEKAIKTTCRQELAEAVRFDSYHHPASSNCWIQVADYCSWAVFKKWEHGDTRTYDQLRGRLVEAELDALRAGTILHYQHRSLTTGQGGR
jgi:hypothetical protein